MNIKINLPKKKKKDTIIRTIKREILFTDSEYDREVKSYLFKNMWYRRTIYNIGIQYILELDKKNDEIPDNEKHKRKYYDKYEWAKMFHHEYEVEGKPLHGEFIQMVKGIRAMVARDLETSNNQVWKNRKDGIHSEVQFRQFNRNNQSFGVENKYISRDKTKDRYIYMIMVYI